MATPRYSRLKDRKVTPYIYFVQAKAPPFQIKIGAAQRPLLGLYKLQASTAVPLALVGAVRAYAVFADILHRAFGTTPHAGAWITPNASILLLLDTLKLRKPGQLLLADEMETLMRRCFPHRPDAWGFSRYRHAEACLRATRRGADETRDA